MLKKSSLIVSSILSILTLPSALAIDMPDVGEAFGMIGQVLYSISTNSYAQFAIVAIILYILLYQIFKAPLKKVPVFEGKSGNVIAAALALLADLGIVYKARDVGLEGFLAKVFGPNKLFAGAIIAIVLFFILRKSLGNKTKLALLLTGLTCLVLANMLQLPMMGTIGLFMMLGSGIWFMASHASPSAGGSSFTSKLKSEWGSKKGFGSGIVKKAKDWGKTREKDEKKIKKDKIDEKKLSHKQKKQIKEDHNIYAKLIKAIESQNTQKIIELSRELDESVKKEIQLYIKEREDVVDEQKLDVQDEAITEKEREGIEELKKYKQLDKNTKKDAEKEENIEIKEDKTQREEYSLDNKEKEQFAKLGTLSNEIEGRLRSLVIKAQEEQFKECLKIAQEIKSKLQQRDEIWGVKEGFREKGRKVAKKLKKLVNKQHKLEEEVEKDVNKQKDKDKKEDEQLEFNFKE